MKSSKMGGGQASGDKQQYHQGGDDYQDYQQYEDGNDSDEYGE